MPKSKNATEERHERLAEELHAVAEHAQALASATGAELAAKSQEIQDRIEGVLEMARSAGAEIQE